MMQKLKIALVISFFINVLLIGVLLGSWSHTFGSGHFPPPRIRETMEKLPSESQEKIHDAMERTREAGHDNVKELRAARAEMTKILKTDPFDAEAYDRQAAKIADLKRAMGKRMSDTVRDLATQLPVEQRPALMGLLRPPPPPPPPHHGDGPPPPPPGDDGAPPPPPPE